MVMPTPLLPRPPLLVEACTPPCWPAIARPSARIHLSLPGHPRGAVPPVAPCVAAVLLLRPLRGLGHLPPHQAGSPAPLLLSSPPQPCDACSWAVCPPFLASPDCRPASPVLLSVGPRPAASVEPAPSGAPPWSAPRCPCCPWLLQVLPPALRRHAASSTWSNSGPNHCCVTHSCRVDGRTSDMCWPLANLPPLHRNGISTSAPWAGVPAPPPGLCDHAPIDAMTLPANPSVTWLFPSGSLVYRPQCAVTHQLVRHNSRCPQIWSAKASLPPVRYGMKARLDPPA